MGKRKEVIDKILLIKKYLNQLAYSKTKKMKMIL